MRAGPAARGSGRTQGQKLAPRCIHPVQAEPDTRVLCPHPSLHKTSNTALPQSILEQAEPDARVLFPHLSTDEVPYGEEMHIAVPLLSCHVIPISLR